MNDTDRLKFMCDENHMRKIEHHNGLWRVYQDMSPPEFPDASWRAMTNHFYSSYRKAIDAAFGWKKAA